MSSLLLPGDPGFDSPSPSSPAIFAGDLVGRILSLDVTVQKRYQVSSSGRNQNTRARPRGPQKRSAGFGLV